MVRIAWKWDALYRYAEEGVERTRPIGELAERLGRFSGSAAAKQGLAWSLLGRRITKCSSVYVKMWTAALQWRARWMQNLRSYRASGIGGVCDGSACTSSGKDLDVPAREVAVTAGDAMLGGTRHQADQRGQGRVSNNIRHY